MTAPSSRRALAGFGVGVGQDISGWGSTRWRIDVGTVQMAAVKGGDDFR
jgi:hypothetical protein